MSLRGAVQDFPLETVVQLIAATAKTGQLELRGDGTGGGSLGFDAGRLVAANSGEDVGEPALGAVFSITAGDFEFVPWNDPPAANLAGDLDQLLDRAAAERDRVVADREIIPDDRMRFALSERAASQGEITLSSEQWRALLAVNGERDLGDVARQLKQGRLATLSILAALVRAGMLDTLEPAPAAAAPAAEAQPEPPAWQQQAPPPAAPSWEQPSSAPAAPSWDQPAPPPPAPSWEQTRPAASWEAPAAPAWEPGAPPWDPVAAQPAEAAEAAPLDDRLSALSGIFGPPAPAAEPEAETDPRLATFGQAAAPTAAAGAEAPAQVEEAREEKKKGLFGRFKKDEAAPAGASTGARARAGRLATFANALLDEYNSGQYGKGRIDDRMTNLVMRVDEQADPIDRPLPILDDRIDVSALERVDMPPAQSGPYLALLINQIHGDAEKALGRDKAKKGYIAARQRIFGSDTSWLAGFDIAGKLPKV